MDMKKERLKRKLTTKQVAEKIGVSIRTVESWEALQKDGTTVRNPSTQVQMLVEKGILD